MSRRILYRDALNEALREEMLNDATVFVMGEGIAERGGSYKVTAGLLEEFGSLRVIDTPIAEASFTGAGVGAHQRAHGGGSRFGFVHRDRCEHGFVGQSRVDGHYVSFCA